MDATSLLEGPCDPSGMLPCKADFALAIAHIQLDQRSPLPIYEQICFALRAAIIAGDLPAGMVLPTGRDLATSLGVARNTVGSAYSRLVAEGYLVSNKRRGTRVAENPFVRWPASARATQLENGRLENGSPERPDIGYHARQSLDCSDADDMSAPSICAPDPSLYPRIALGRLLNEEFCRPPSGSNNATARFQSAIASYLRRMRGVRCEPEQVIPIASSQSAIDLIVRVLVDPGHCVYVEDPGLSGPRQAFRHAGARLISMASDGQEVDSNLKTAPPPRIIFASPSVNIPLGRQMSEGRRLSIYEFAKRSNAVVVEYDHAAELSFIGSRLRAIQGFDDDNRVIYFGSLEEILGPHIRIAYLVVPTHFVGAFTRTANSLGYCPELFVLGALARFFDENHYSIHVKAVRSLYAERLSLVSAACRAKIRNAVLFEPNGGLSVALKFTEDLDERALCRSAATLNIAVAPLSHFYEVRPAPVGLVFGFGTLADRLVDVTIGRLAELLFRNAVGQPTA